MTLFKCKECGQEFDSQRGLHAHFKKHKITVADYYIKHFPRFDLYSNAPIRFKSVDQYMDSDFNSSANFKKWCRKEDKDTVKKYLVDTMRKKINEKGSSSVMGQAQLDSYGWPSIAQIEELFGCYRDFCQNVEKPPQFGFTMPESFYEDHSQKTIWVDTREQKPLNFINPVKEVKLDYGDYTIGGEDFQNTFVDRKSPEDFIGTFGRELERFKREMERCVSTGGYMFIVVDATMAKVAETLAFSRSKINIHHLWHNMREILSEFNGDCQFVFSGGRTNSAHLVPKILACGKSLWKVDVQFYIEKDDLWLGM